MMRPKVHADESTTDLDASGMTHPTRTTGRPSTSRTVGKHGNRTSHRKTTGVGRRTTHSRRYSLVTCGLGTLLCLWSLTLTLFFPSLRIGRLNNGEFRRGNVRVLRRPTPTVLPGGSEGPGSTRPGVVVLGMHRSGTSLLSGLLVMGLAYDAGGPLIGGAFDNPKGFFERVDVVAQNDALLRSQHAHWSANVALFDPARAVRESTLTAEGRRGLAFLNGRDAHAPPYLQKDPRMCVTLPVWLPLLDHEPAVLFTYRHPLDVARSLRRREREEGHSPWALERGLRLWIVYNRQALLHSRGLCRVFAANDAVLATPHEEIRRLADELTHRCGVRAPVRTKPRPEDVEKFVDPKLQHRHSVDHNHDTRTVLTSYNDGACVVHDYEREATEPIQAAREMDLYLKAMRIFCDLKNGAAYKDDYEWPTIS